MSVLHKHKKRHFVQCFAETRDLNMVRKTRYKHIPYFLFCLITQLILSILHTYFKWHLRHTHFAVTRCQTAHRSMVLHVFVAHSIILGFESKT
jgi:hypothetical protein